MISNEELIELEYLLEEEQIHNSRLDLLAFTQYTMPNFLSSHFHKTYYDLLDKFAHGQLKG